jgi:hypothetical protein
MSERKIRALSIGCEISDYMNKTVGVSKSETRSEWVFGFSICG